jgi:hypothetical protein
MIDARPYHRSFFWGEWMIAIGGEGVDRLELIEPKRSWKEGLWKESGNQPFAMSRFAMVPIEDTRLLLFGGADATKRNPVGTAYILDLTGHVIERTSQARRIMARHRPLSCRPLVSLRPSSVLESKTPTKRPWEVAPPTRPHSEVFQGQHGSVSPLLPGGRPVSMKEIGLATFQDDFLLQNGINFASLPERVQKAIQMKIRGYWMKLEENMQLEEKIRQIMLAISPIGELLPQTRLFLKIVRKDENKSRVLTVLSDQSADELRKIVCEVIGRQVSLSIQTANKTQVKLTEEGLRAAHREVCRKQPMLLVLFVD